MAVLHDFKQTLLYMSSLTRSISIFIVMVLIVTLLWRMPQANPLKSGDRIPLLHLGYRIHWDQVKYNIHGILSRMTTVEDISDCIIVGQYRWPQYIDIQSILYSFLEKDTTGQISIRPWLQDIKLYAFSLFIQQDGNHQCIHSWYRLYVFLIISIV